MADNDVKNNIVDETIFTKNLDELLLFFNSQKVRLVEFVKNNFKENEHYIIRKAYNDDKKGSGGHNKINYLLTDYVYNVTRNTFNLKHRYVRTFLDNVEQMKIIHKIPPRLEILDGDTMYFNYGNFSLGPFVFV